MRPNFGFWNNDLMLFIKCSKKFKFPRTVHLAHEQDKSPKNMKLIILLI